MVARTGPFRLAKAAFGPRLPSSMLGQAYPASKDRKRLAVVSIGDLTVADPRLFTLHNYGRDGPYPRQPAAVSFHRCIIQGEWHGIQSENVRHYRKLLEEETDRHKREIIRQLLADEEAKELSIQRRAAR